MGKYCSTYVICLVGNEGHQVVGNDSKVVVINRKSEVCLQGHVHDSDAVLGTWLEDRLVPGSAIAIGIRAVDEPVLERGWQTGGLSSFPL